MVVAVFNKHKRPRLSVYISFGDNLILVPRHYSPIVNFIVIFTIIRRSCPSSCSSFAPTLGSESH